MHVAQSNATNGPTRKTLANLIWIKWQRPVLTQSLQAQYIKRKQNASSIIRNGVDNKNSKEATLPYLEAFARTLSW